MFRNHRVYEFTISFYFFSAQTIGSDYLNIDARLWVYLNITIAHVYNYMKCV